jgi:FtsZ-binding cell division protein ZapB
METQEGNQRVDNLENKLQDIFKRILDNTATMYRSTKEKIQIIAQTIDGYRHEIEELKEKLTPTAPPEVTSKKEHQESLQIDMIKRETKEVT